MREAHDDDYDGVRVPCVVRCDICIFLSFALYT